MSRAAAVVSILTGQLCDFRDLNKKEVSFTHQANLSLSAQCYREEPLLLSLFYLDKFLEPST